MNCRQVQQYILLKFSGEIGVVAHARLQRHLARCAACRQFEKEYTNLQHAVRAQQPNADERTVGAILAYARSRTPQLRITNAWLTWRPALVYSALSVAALVIFLLAISPHLQPAPQQLAQKEVVSPAQEFTAVSEFDDVAGKLDELNMWVELSMLEMMAVDYANITTWADTERLAEQLLQWEEVQI